MTPSLLAVLAYKIISSTSNDKKHDSNTFKTNITSMHNRAKAIKIFLVKIMT